MKKVYCPTDYREKQMQRALLQYGKPENRNLVREALKLAGREDLIGFDSKCLVKPDMRAGSDYMKSQKAYGQRSNNKQDKNAKNQKNSKNTNTKSTKNKSNIKLDNKKNSKNISKNNVKSNIKKKK
jgi:hypothetical protein